MRGARAWRRGRGALKPTLAIVAVPIGVWWMIWTIDHDKATGMRTVAVAVFNAPILAICATVPFIGSLRSALWSKGPAGAIESTSYSRITGLFGAVVVTAFFWAMGNVILWHLFEQPETADKIINSVWKFFLLGSALFLPYAFNQLRSIFVDRQKQTLEMARLKLAPGVTVPGTPGTRVLVNKV